MFLQRLIKSDTYTKKETKLLPMSVKATINDVIPEMLKARRF